MLKHLLPEDHLKEIGDITVSFALLEFHIQHLIGSLINEHQRIGQIITAELSFKSLRALLISLYLERHGEDDDFNKLRDFMKRAGQTEEKRNQIVHSVWAAGKDKQYITRIKTTAKEKYGIRFNFEEVSIKDLNEFANDIRKLAEELMNFQSDMLSRHKIINNPIEKIWP